MKNGLTKNKAIIAWILITLMTASLILTGCGDKEESADSGLEKVTLVLDYVPNTNHTGFYVAKDKGYFEEQGLDVEIIEPGDNSVTTLVAAGKADVGISFQEDVTYALTGEEPMPIKAIGTVIQHNTSGFASIKDKKIKTPKDFENKTYAGWGSPSEESVIEAVMKADKGDFSTVDITVSDGSGYTLLKDKVDFMWFFWAWDGISAKRAGFDLNYVELRDLDERLDYYTPVVITSDDTIDKKGDTLKKFMKASRQGYDFSVDDPEAAAKILHNNAEDYDLDMLVESQKYLADKYIDDARYWGEMKDEVWNRYTDFMFENELIDKKIDASDCYTNDFLNKE